MSNIVTEVFFQLVRLGVGNNNYKDFTRTENISEEQWEEVKSLAERQGLLAVVTDGLENMPQAIQPPKLIKLQFIAEVLQHYEHRHKLYMRAIAELAAFYNAHGFKMMILKGYACSLDWPKPEHRPCGDIDVWLFGEYKAADALLARKKGISIDNGHHHHTVFYWRDFMVENHYDFIDVHHRKSSAKLESLFKEMGKDDSHKVELHGESVFFPDVNLHALFLIYHTVLHFTSTEMNIRQILDWGFFVKAHGKDIDWNWLMKMVEAFHLKDFLDIVNAICIEELGFDTSMFHKIQFDPQLKQRVLNDTLFPEFTEKEPKNILRRFFFRYRRWKSHEWKHKLCYEESMWSIFWSAVWAHILKPRSI